MKDWKRCYGCMNPLETENDQKACPVCGFLHSQYNVGCHILPLGTQLLGGRYVIGRKIGAGGFGITYIGWDTALEHKVAVKEYYPTDFVDRDTTKSYSVSVRDKEELVQRERNHFLEEAKMLYSLSGNEGIVHIENIIEQENDTSYIIMEFLEGITLKNYCHQQPDHKMTPEAVLKVMEPVVRCMEEVHEKGFLHRDISPDNIMLCENGAVKLLDFGAARRQDRTQFTTIVKAEFSPPEQRYRKPGQTERSKGLKQQGPWTDVYALCATMYYLLAGRAAQTAQGRAYDMLEKGEDSLIPVSHWNQMVSPELSRIIQKGMSMKGSNRYQSMKELYHALYEGEIRKKETGMWKWLPAGLILVILCVGVAAALMHRGNMQNTSNMETASPVKTTAPRRYTMVSVTRMKKKAAIAAIRKIGLPGLTVKCKGKYSQKVPRGKVISQNIKQGTEWDEKEEVKVILYLSKGPRSYEVPDVTGKEEADAKDRLSRKNWRVHIVREYHDTISKGQVIDQNPAGGSRLKKRQTVTLVVSLGKKEIKTTVKTKILPPM